MATFKMVLSKSQHQKKTNSGLSMLMLRYTHKKKVTYFTTHKNIEDRLWDDRNQKAKRSYPGSDRFNIYLNSIRQRVEDIVNGILIEGGDPTPALVKQKYQRHKEKQNRKTRYSFFEYFNVYIAEAKKHKRSGTIKKYVTTVNNLRKYERYAKVQLDWHNIDMEFYYDFLEYYTEVLGHTNNGFGGLIKVVKAVINDALEKGYTKHTGHRNKNFRALKEEVNNIYLDEGELQRIIDLDLSYDGQMERVRDLFIVGCYTGLRFSDFSQIRKQNITGNVIKVKTLKTDQWVTIPIMKQVLDVMERYSGTPNGLPKSCKNQTMNRHLKEIGRRAGIDAEVLKVRNSGNKRVENPHKKYQLITTHTARRSFATNMYKRGIPSRVIMAITGHVTESAFNSYIKISREENAELMLRYLESA